MTLRWRGFPLHPEVPLGGISLATFFGGRQAQIEAMRARLEPLFRQEGLPYGDPDRTFNTRRAQELAAWAADRPQADALHAALFRAVFVEVLNIADLSVLAQVAASVGLDAAEAIEVVSSGLYAAAVDEDWAAARRLGITGVPAQVAYPDARPPILLVGAHPTPTLERLVETAGARRR